MLLNRAELCRNNGIKAQQKNYRKIYFFRGITIMTILQKKQAVLKAFEEKAQTYEKAIAELTEKANEVKARIAPTDDLDKSTKALAKEYCKLVDRVLKVLVKGDKTEDNE